MSWRTYRLAVILGLCLGGPASGADEPPQQPRNDSRVQPSDRASIERLIHQLGSSKFAEREEATKQLKRLGKPAEVLLREAARKDPDLEVRRRAAQLVDVRRADPLIELLKEATRLEARKDYRKAAELLKKAVAEARPRFDPGSAAEPLDIRILMDVYLRLGRANRLLNDCEAAAKAFNWARYYADNGFNVEAAKRIDQECLAMTGPLLAGWDKTVRSKLARSGRSKALMDRYPLVLLHSGRYGACSYLRSAYSFLYGSADEARHHNNVQLWFDNRLAHNCNFLVNMLPNSTNEVADLERADFRHDPDPRRVPPNSWSTCEETAVEGHVYLEHVRDTDRNDFYVVFQILAVDKDSRYVAFVWRRLPGGKMVLRH
jgi:hypothetical protein